MGLIRTTRPVMRACYGEQPSGNFLAYEVSEDGASHGEGYAARWGWYWNGGLGDFELIKTRQYVELRNAPWEYPHDCLALLLKICLAGDYTDHPNYMRMRLYLFDAYVNVSGLTWATQPVLPTDAGQIIDLDLARYWLYGGDPNLSRYAAVCMLKMGLPRKSDTTRYDIYALCLDPQTTPPAPIDGTSYSHSYGRIQISLFPPLPDEYDYYNSGRICLAAKDILGDA